MPTFAHGLVIALRYADRGWEGIGDFKGFGIAFIVGVVLMLVAVFLFVHWIDGLCFLGGLMLCVYFTV